MYGRVFFTYVEAFLAQNQLVSRLMNGIEARAPRPPVNVAALPGTGVLFAMLALMMAVGFAVLAFMSARAAEPLVVVALATLAFIGSFFLFGLAAGHIRFAGSADATAGISALVDQLDQGLMVKAQDGTIVLANQHFRDMVGADDNGELRALETAFAGEPQAAECLFRLTRAVERGEPRVEEFRVRDHDNRARAARWLRLAVRPMAGEIGHLDGTDGDGASLWQLTDITEQRAREAEVVRGLETALATYDAMPIGQLSAAPDGRITHFNGRIAQWLAIDTAQSATRTLTLNDVIAGDGEALLKSSMARARGQTVRLKLDLVREDGVGLPVEIIGEMADSGPHAGEITAFVLAQPTTTVGDAAGAEARYARLFHSAPFGIATLGDAGRILSSNASFARMFFEAGLAEAGSIGALIASAGDEEAVKAIETALVDARAGRATLAPIEISFGTDRQHTRRLYMSPIAQSGRQGETAMLYVIDATEQKALELKYAQSTKMEAVGKLAGGIAHDFNNVLTAIIGFSDLLLQTHRPTDAAHKDIMNIKRNANRAAGLVRQLLAFSRRQTLQPETLELGEVLTDLSVLLKRLIGEKVDLKITSGRDLWFVKADRTQFDQVIINLAVNAKDAMLDGGRLNIRTRNVSERDAAKLRHQSVTPGEYVCVEVEDGGHGMTPEIMAKIFEPFFSTKEVGKGTGLGLATVYGIVKQTGGYIFPESAPGKGTTFRVYLPRHIPEPATEAAPAPAPKKEGKRDLTGTGRVLLVEDEDAVRSFAVRALKRQGYEVLEASTGVEALELVAKDTGTIDIVVSDVVMPEMDGPTMLIELRKTKADLKVIFVSGYPDDRFKTVLDPNAQFAFLQKPFTLAQLASKVKDELAK